MLGSGRQITTAMENGRNKEKIRSSNPIISRIYGLIPGLRQNSAFNYVMLAALSIGVGILSLLLGATIYGLPLFKEYMASFIIVLLNILPVILLVFLVYFISGRAWIAFTFPSLFILAISVIHYFKIELRGDPLALTDYSYFIEAGTALSDYSPTMNWKIYLAAAAFVCGVVLSLFLLKRKLRSAPLRIIAVVAVIAVSAILYIFVYTDTELYDSTTDETPSAAWTPNYNFIRKGFLYPFIYDAKYSLANRKALLPDWYDKREAKEAYESYNDADIPDDKKVNIISIMLEAYADLSQFGVLDFTEDVYGPLHRLQAESVSGTLVTNVFGGGTIDTERLFLTGNIYLTTYTSPTNSYVYYLKNQGYRTEGFHAGDMWFYDRRSVNSHLGFDDYYFLEDFENVSRSDCDFFAEIHGMYETRNADMPYFSFNVSYQNHGPYENFRTREPYVIEQGEMSDESFDILNNYLLGIYDTGLQYESFIDSLRYDSEPVVILIFGDHMPWLGNMHSVYYELGMDIDIDSEEGFYSYYSAPYFIWANDAAKQILENDFTGDGGSFSPGFLMGELFSLCSWEGEGYMQALRELQTHIDVINAPMVLFRENGLLTPDLSPEGVEAFKRLRMVELYRLKNYRY